MKEVVFVGLIEKLFPLSFRELGTTYYCRKPILRPGSGQGTQATESSSWPGHGCGWSVTSFSET